MKDLIGKIYTGDNQEFFNLLKNFKSSNVRVIVTANPEIVMYSRNNKEMYQNIMGSTTYVTADGISIVKAYKKMFGKKIERLTGVDIVEEIFNISNNTENKILIYGTTDDVLEALKEQLIQKGISVNLECINGFDFSEEYIIDRIEETNPDFVLVPQGVPRQEKIIYTLLEYSNNSIFIGCGGAIDVLSGKINRAPEFIQKLNLEWLYRIVKQPKRIIRFINNQLKFAMLLLFKKY